MSSEKFIQKTLSVGPLQCNCQILVCPKTLETVIVDPGEEPEKILRELESIEGQLGSKLKVRALFHTHAHFDHIAATRKVKEHFFASGIEAPQIFLHKADEFIYQKLPFQGQMFGFEFGEPLPVDHFFEDEKTYNFGSLKLTVLHTPGHSPGGVCFRMHSDSDLKIPETVFTGDTLFRESVGRTDLWGGDAGILKKSIKDRLLVLDQDTVAWPGHGPSTLIGFEKKNNSFV